VSLRAQESANSQKMDVVFRVVDSGKGMSEDFQKNHLFVPFSQADTFEPGVGLGLSIVKQIIDSLGGTIDIKSVQNVGTEVEVRMSLALADASKKADEEIAAVVAKTKGLRLCLLDPNRSPRYHALRSLLGLVRNGSDESRQSGGCRCRCVYVH
jgi:hypothetical protein